MGNDQSSASGSGVSNSLSFLSGKKGSAYTNKKAGGVVVVKPGTEPLPNPNDDEILKRFKEIPKFYPILKGALNQPGLRNPPDITTKISHKPLLRFAVRIQDHIGQCARIVSSEQNALATKIKDNDYIITTLVGKLSERKKRLEHLSSELEKVRELRTEVADVMCLLQDLVPFAETLNELLPEEERLPLLNLGSVLERSPFSSSTDSTPSPEQNSLTKGRRLTSSAGTGAVSNLHIEPVEELTVIDKPSQN